MWLDKVNWEYQPICCWIRMETNPEHNQPTFTLEGSEKGNMKPNELIAEASTTINAPVAKVWTALVTPDQIKQYMFGTTVVTDWQEGSPIVWKGEWQGKAYEDKGKILKLEKPKILQYSHFSPLSGASDSPENYHTVTIKLAEKGQKTTVSLTQDHNESEEERQHAVQNWDTFLHGMKKFLEA